MSAITLPKHLEDSLHWALELLHNSFGESVLRIGGGSILAARWHHRRSTDIDLFVDANLASEWRKKDAQSFRELVDSLTSQAQRGTVQDLQVFDSGCTFISPFGPVLIFATRRFTRNARSRDIETSSGFSIESNAEILFKKIFGRIIRSVTYTGRDLYDFIVAYMLDSTSLNRVFRRLDEAKVLHYLDNDAVSGDTVANELDRVFEPRYPELISDINEFNALATAVLGPMVTPLIRQHLESIRDSKIPRS